MKPNRVRFVAAVLTFVLALPALRAGGREMATVEGAAETVAAMSEMPLRCVPPTLMQDARAVAVIPDVIKAGLLLGGRFGRGVVLVRGADGCWSNPIFVTLGGGSIGWQIGVQSTDVVLVFKTRTSLDRILRGKGKVTLGADVAIAAGPVGRQAEAATDAQLKAEIFSYSRSRGLFAGVSIEGAGLVVDCDANEAFYGPRGRHPADLLALRAVPLPRSVVTLQDVLTRMSTPPPPPPALEAPVPPPGR